MITPLRRHTGAVLTTAFTLAGLTLATCALSWHGFTLAQWISESRSGVVLYHSGTRSRVVALTFDDGPSPRFTPRVLAILRRYHARATFFEIGRMVRAHPVLARDVLAAGNCIGNHTWSHPHLERRSRRGVHTEIARCDTELRTALDVRTHLFRPPRGQWNPTIFREARRNGDRIILWTVAVEHHDAPTPVAMAARALRLVGPGGILLMHDGGGPSRQRTVQALPLILSGLQKRGYRFVTVPELLHIRGNDALATASTQGSGSVARAGATAPSGAMPGP